MNRFVTTRATATRRGSAWRPGHALAVAVAVSVLFGGRSASAQDASSSASQDPPAEEPVRPPIPSDGDAQQTIELRLVDALRLGRMNNVDLAAESIVPSQLAEDLRIENAFFEPELFADASYRRFNTPAQNIFQPSIQRELVSGRFGLRQNVVSGALYELSFAPVRTRQQADIPGFPDRLYNSDLAFSVTQPLLRGAWSDYGLAGVRTAEASLVGGRERFNRQVQDVLLQIVDAYWELVFAREDYYVVFQALDLAREQLRITNERIRVRQLAERDRVSDEADVARRIEELITAENEIKRREDVLRELLFNDADGQLWLRHLVPVSPIKTEFDRPDEDWRAVASEALRQRPDLHALRSDVRVAEVALRRAQRDVLPQLDLVGGYAAAGVAGPDRSFSDAWHDTGDLDFPDWNVGLQFAIPIGNNAARAVRDRAVLELERRRRDLYAAEQQVSLEVRDALRQLGTLSESINASQESVRLAETVLDTEREKVKVGRSTIFEVQQRNQELEEARRRLLRNALDYRKAEAELLHVRGRLRSEEDILP